MKLTFHGAARTVTGSQHLVEVNGYRILLDSGLYQGKRKEAFEMNRQGFVDARSIDCLVLSHAHIDHSGNIPSLVRNGFSGDIICTSATRDLCAVMLMDSAHIQEKDVEFVNKRRQRDGKKEFEPLYTREDVVVTMGQFVGISYNRRFQVLPDIYVTLTDAGHMMGSANIIMDVLDGEDNRQKRLIFSGDIGRPGIPIIRDPAVMSEGADILIMESTYGNRLHPPYEDTEKELERTINETYRNGGCLLIPAFAVGRTQQIVYALHKLHNRRDIPAMPIFVDSPLATRVTDIFRLHPETYDRDIRDFLLNDEDRNPFGFGRLLYTQTVEQSKELNFLREPAIIISASGMMEGGRILHHLRNRIDDPKTTILITGWQAPNTLGRYIVEGSKTVRIFGEEYEVNARVKVMTGMSGHADSDGLLAWARNMQQKPAHTFIVHGEEAAAANLAGKLTGELGFAGVSVPEPHQSFSV